MDVRAIREMSDEQLLNEIEDLKQALFNLRFQDASGQLENQNVIRYTRRDIARLKTVVRERQLAADAASKEKQNG
jgi:large subunit ribosomal protein L29